MSRVIYSFLLRLLSPLLLLWMGLRAKRVGGRWDILGAKRFGYYRGKGFKQKPIWIHAVSLGETRAAQPLIQALLDQGHSVLLTHLTYTGRAEGARVFQQAIAEQRLCQQWLPYDFPGACKRFMRFYDLAIAVIIEREVWPNLMHTAVKANIPVILASARFSEASLRRSLRIGKVMWQAYSSFTAIYAQSLHDAQRLELAGGRAVRVAGNFKFDVVVNAEQVERGQRFAQDLGRKVVVLASSREGEEALFLPAIQRVIKREQQLDVAQSKRTLFYIVPRHPQRFDTVYQLLVEAGLRTCRRSDNKNLGDGCLSAVKRARDMDVVLGDTLGELPWYYAQAHVAIVGGSFEPLGGQNFIEASALGIPVIVGTHTRNFEQAVSDALAAGAILRANNANIAMREAMRLLEDRVQHEQMANAARYWVQQHKGSVERVIVGINEILKQP